jgi:hypothetical protein
MGASAAENGDPSGSSSDSNLHGDLVVGLNPLSILFELQTVGSTVQEDINTIEAVTISHLNGYISKRNNGHVELKTSLSSHLEEIEGLNILTFQSSAIIIRVSTDVDLTTLQEKLEFDQQQAFIGENLEEFVEQVMIDLPGLVCCL